MLMSNVGGTNAVYGGGLTFRRDWPKPAQAAALVPPWPLLLGPCNYAGETQMPRVGVDPPPVHSGQYSIDLDDFQYDDPNGPWKLYIYDRFQGMAGELDSSWQINFDFQ